MDIATFYRNIYQDNRLRKERQRSLRRDLWLYAKNRALRPLERVAVARRADTPWPIGLIVGAPRSGTTLLYQLMARYLDVGYIPNRVARYWMVPVVVTAATRQVVTRARDDLELASHLGATAGDAAPHEFGYFWHFWSGFFDSDDLTAGELDRVDWRSIQRELVALAATWRAPLVLKAVHHVNYSIQRVALEIPQARFIAIERDERFVVQSILEARIKRYGDERHWWSLRPRDFRAWARRTPVEQVVHQVRDVQRGVRRGLGPLAAARKHSVRYEDLVARPAAEIERLAAFLGARVRDPAGLAALSLHNGNHWRAPAARQNEVLACLQPGT